LGLRFRGGGGGLAAAHTERPGAARRSAPHQRPALFGPLPFPAPAAASRGRRPTRAHSAPTAPPPRQVIHDIAQYEWAGKGRSAVRFEAGFEFYSYHVNGKKEPETRDLGVVVLSVVPKVGEACLVVAFRGTKPLTTANWQDDLTALPDEGVANKWLLHPGFLNALGLDVDMQDKRMAVRYRRAGGGVRGAGDRGTVGGAREGGQGRVGRGAGLRS
jgi:hypothetical protein